MIEDIRGKGGDVMDCKKFREYLDNYENLSTEEKLEMTEHTAVCGDCADELDFMLSVIETARSLPQIASPPDFIDKLNIRLDAVDEKKQRTAIRVMMNARKNWRQYTAAAACFALVAVLIANGSSLLGGMEPSDGGVIQEETIVTGGISPLTSDTPSDAERSAAVKTAETNKQSAPAEKNDEKAEESLGKTENGAGEKTRVTSAPVINTAAAAGAPSKSAAIVPVSAQAKPEPVKNGANSTVKATEIPAVNDKSADGGYSMAPADEIAGLGSVSLPETETTPYNEAPKPAEDITKSYSLAKEGSIAHGQYYRIDRNGNPIKEETNKAIGTIKISSDDVEEAMDVILQYSYNEGDDLYQTDSANLSLMLSTLNGKGVSYTNYTPGCTGDIKFVLVIK